MQLLALRALEAGEEVAISYIDEGEALPLRQANLADYGFVCSCSLCRCAAQCCKHLCAQRSVLGVRA